MCKPLIIPIIGKAQNGKDTFARYLKEELEKDGKEVLTIKYGDYLKFICKEYFEWNGEKDEKGRNLLQYIGTDLCRSNNENVWVAVVCELVKGFGNRFNYVLIPDTRFENEVYYWDKNEFSTFPVKVVRKNEDGSEFHNGLTSEQKRHPSETSLDNFKPFYIIEACSLEQLKESAEVIASEIIKNKI